MLLTNMFKNLLILTFILALTSCHDDLEISNSNSYKSNNCQITSWYDYEGDLVQVVNRSRDDSVITVRSFKDLEKEFTVPCDKLKEPNKFSDYR